MRNIVFGIVIAVIIVFVLRYCEHQKESRERLEATTTMIRKQLDNVGKLVVTEGHYAQVYTYNDSKKFYFDVFSARKKALIVVNAEAAISYDLSQVKTEVDEESRTVTITSIPEPELKINPNIRYYDVTQDYLNQFDAEDYNKIKDRIERSLRKKIMESDLVTNAENRLISELQKIYILTSAMEWTLVYRNEPIRDENDLEMLKPILD